MASFIPYIFGAIRGSWHQAAKSNAKKLQPGDKLGTSSLLMAALTNFFPEIVDVTT
jgi:hypothetical protein